MIVRRPTGSAEAPTARRIALLRGINVGGHRKVPMADLRTLLTEDLGFTDVATYIQSGNVVFSGSGTADEVGAVISTAIHDQFGFDVPVVVRGANMLSTLLARSGELFPAVESDTSDVPPHDKRVMVGFLTTVPSADAVAAIDPDRSPGDSVTIEGDHAHVRYATGQSATKLTGDYLEGVLGVGMTMRNLTTIRKLIDLA